MVVLDRYTTTSRRVTKGLFDLGRQFETSTAGQTLISVVVVIAVVIGIVWNLPESDIKRSMTPTLRPIAAATGLSQVWSMYAPEPVSALETIDVEVSMSDGTVRQWSWQPGDRLLGPFTWYRWQKLKEQTIRQPASRPGFARWVARELTRPTDRPVKVEMLFYRKALSSPGQSEPRHEFVETLYSEWLTPRP
jgi:hypothetical protein